MSKSRLFFLFQLHLNDQLNAEQKIELTNLLADPENLEDAQKLLGEAWEEFEPETPVFTSLQSKNILNHVLASDKSDKEQQDYPLKTVNWNSILAAAAILLMIFSLGILFLPKSIEKGNLNAGADKAKMLKQKSGIKPEGNKAVLILADGKKIALDDMSTGKIANQSGISITKTANGQLVYAIGDQSKPKKDVQHLIAQMNTITTPKGGQFQINLPDGSKVWLNAMSSLKFPTVFQGNERKVELTGEAYFEISSFYVKDVKLPFKVVSKTEDGRSQEVEVLGTHFNINAYGNEPDTKTTLLEGSVKVINLNSNAINILKPGQQAILNVNHTKVSTVVGEDILAWKNGNFLFNNLKLVDIMKQLERWYDVKVNYSNIPDTRYQGVISKSASISEVLDMLELTGNLKFKIESVPGSTEKRIEIFHQ